MPRAKKLPLLLVEWIDSSSMDPGWTRLKQIDFTDPVCCVSVGWLVHEDRLHITLAGNRDGQTPESFCSYFTIPKATIRKKRRLS